MQNQQMSTSLDSKFGEFIDENSPLLASQAINNEITYAAASDGGEGEGEGCGVKVLDTFRAIEALVFCCMMVVFICSLTVKQLKHQVIWDFNLWKWCLFALVISGGRYFTIAFTCVLLILMGNRNISLSNSVMYYLESLKSIIRVLIWLALVLLTRILLFPSKETPNHKMLNYATSAVASSLVGATLWLLKSYSVRLLALSFQSKRFFYPIVEALFLHCYLKTLLDPSSIHTLDCCIEVKERRRTKRQQISPWVMKELIVQFKKKVESEKESKLEAEHAASKIFNNVHSDGCGYISEKDLHRFLKEKEARLLLTSIGGVAESGSIKESDFKNWVIKVYNERRALSHFIKQSDAAIEELNSLFTGIVTVVIIILWLILMEFITIEVLVFVISQLLLAAFMFGNTAKNIFESIIFSYVIHPFDVGDACVIDREEMVVEEIHILTTTFVRTDKKILIYPNSVLANKPIINLYKTIENMRDSVEFVFDPSIKTYGDLIMSNIDLNTDHIFCVLGSIGELCEICPRWD